MDRPSIDDLIGPKPAKRGPGRPAKPFTAERPPPSPFQIDAADLARSLGCTRRQLDNYLSSGKLVAAGRARIDLGASLAACLSMLSARVGAKAQDRKAEADAVLKEIKAAQTRGELLEAGDVQQGWESILADCRASLLAVAPRVRQLHPGLEALVVETLDREILAALSTLSGADSATLVAPDPGNGAGAAPGAATPPPKTKRRGGK